MIKKTGGKINYSKIHKLFSRDIGSKQESKNFLSLILLQVFLSISPNPLSVAPSSPFIDIFSSLISPIGLLPVGFSGYLSHHSSVLPPFHHEIGLLGVFVLFRLIYMHLMWKRLDREPLINVEVTVSMILILSGCFCWKNRCLYRIQDIRNGKLKDLLHSQLITCTM